MPTVLSEHATITGPHKLLRSGCCCKLTLIVALLLLNVLVSDKRETQANKSRIPALCDKVVVLGLHAVTHMKPMSPLNTRDSMQMNVPYVCA